MTRAYALTLASELTDAQLWKAMGCLGWRHVPKYRNRWKFYRNYYCVPKTGDADWSSMPTVLAKHEDGNPLVWRLTPLGVHVVRIAMVARNCEATP